MNRKSIKADLKAKTYQNKDTLSLILLMQSMVNQLIWTNIKINTASGYVFLLLKKIITTVFQHLS